MRNLLAILLLTAAALTPARAQWTEPVRISEPGECWYPQILAHGDTLHVAYSNDTGGWKISYVRSTDGGQTWSPYQVLSDTVNTTQTVLPRIMNNGNSILVLWITYFPDQVYWYDIGYRVSNDNGISWGPYEYVLDPNWPGSFYMSASGSDSLINIITSGRSGDSTIYKNIRSTDFGATWSQPQLLFSVFDSGRTDCASHDTLVHLSWTGRFDLDHDREIYYTRSTNGGLDWNPSIPLSDTDQFASQLPSIDAGPFGSLALTWMDFKYAPPGATGDVFIRQSTDWGGIWSAEHQLTYNHYSFVSDVVRTGDTIHLVWDDESEGIGHRKIGYLDNWSGLRWISRSVDDSRDPGIARSDGDVFAVWAVGWRSQNTSGIYFSRWQGEPNGVEEEGLNELPQSISIFAYPNPFNSYVAIVYSSAKGGEIKIINSLGQFVNGFEVEASVNGKISWNGTDQDGKPVTSGVYIVRFQSGSKTKIVKLIYLR
jgi:hypothetical protein